MNPSSSAERASCRCSKKRERKFEKDVKEDNYLRIERAYGSFMRSFSLPNTVSWDNIRADYRNGVLTLHMAKREEPKRKQIKISVSTNGKQSTPISARGKCCLVP